MHIVHVAKEFGMYVTADVAITPSGQEDFKAIVPAVENVFLAAGLITRTHAYGTTVEGDWHTVLTALEACHRLMHARGASDVRSAIRVL